MALNVVILDSPTAAIDLEVAVLARVGASVRRAESRDRQSIESLIAETDAILCDSTTIDATLLDRCTRVQVISQYGIGYDNIDVGAASQRGIWVANVPGFCADEVADHTVALILSANRRIIALDRSVRSGQWDAVVTAFGTGRLSRQTLGLIGFGEIGQRVARRALGFGLRVLAHSRRLTRDQAERLGVTCCPIEQVLADSDYVSLHVPATPSTFDLFGEWAFSRMKPTAWLINTSRGSIVDEEALGAALKAGRLGGAALDVRRTEAPTAIDALYLCPNVILTPHAGWYSTEAIIELRRRAAQNVASTFSGGTPDHPVNPNLRPRFGPDAETHPTWI